MKNLIITIDGTYGAAKSTVAKSLAKKLDYKYINTGAMYKQLGKKLLERKIHPENKEKVIEIAKTIKNDLSEKLEEIDAREIYDIVSRKQKAVLITTKSESDLTKSVLEEYLGYELTEENSSIEFTGSTLSQGFYKQLIISIIFAFILMAIVVFIIFRTLIPSSAVVISAFADIFMTLVVVNLLGIKVSSAGIIAFLMLIGYSVDTDILLTNRVLKRKDDSLNERIYGAFKTGITMTLTSLLAVIFALFVVKDFSVVLTQIFTILSIGLTFDIFNTWITNVSILKWYVHSKTKN